MDDFKIFDVEHNGYVYTVQYDLDTVMAAQAAGVLGMTDKPIEMAFMCFYYGVLKNHPNATMGTTRRFFDEVIKDPDYGTDAFADIIDEFTRVYSFFGNRSKGKKKLFSARQNSKMAVPPPVK